MERETGIEPATNSLEGCDSTTELLPQPLAISHLQAPVRHAGLNGFHWPVYHLRRPRKSEYTRYTAMKEHLQIMKVSLRVLTAHNEMYAPEPDDVEALRQYLGADGLWELDDLACEVIKRALWARDRIRAAIRRELMTPVA